MCPITRSVLLVQLDHNSVQISSLSVVAVAAAALQEFHKTINNAVVHRRLQGIRLKAAAAAAFDI